MTQWLKVVVLRHRMRYLVQGVLWCVVALAVSRTISHSATQSLPVVVLLFATVLVSLGTILFAWKRRARRVWALDSAARWADEQLNLKHRLASVLYLERAAGAATGSVLARPLINQAADRLSGVKPSSVAPLVDRLTWVAALATLLAICAMVFSQAMIVPVDAPTLAETASPQVPNVTVEDVQAAAEQVALDSTMRDVDALMSAAGGLELLLQDAAIGLAQQELNQRFKELLDMARMGYGDTPPSWVSRNNTSEQSLASRINDYEAARRHESSQANNPAASGARAAEARDPTNTPRPGSLTAGEVVQMAEVMPGPDAPTLPGLPGTEQAPLLGSPVGASSQAGAGGSDIAGLGTQNLEASAFSAQETPGTKMFLPTTKTGAGKRIKIDMTLPPGMVAGEAGDTAAQRLAVAATPAVMEVDRDLILSRDAINTARYFAATGAGAEEGIR